MISKELDEDYFDAKADILQTRINSFLRRSQGGLIDSAVKALIVSTLKETSEDQKELFVGRGWQRLAEVGRGERSPVAEDGEIIASSKGLHLYNYVWELAEIIRGKTIEEFRNGE